MSWLRSARLCVQHPVARYVSQRALRTSSRCCNDASTSSGSTALKEQPRDLLHLIRQHIKVRRVQLASCRRTSGAGCTTTQELTHGRLMDHCLSHATCRYASAIRLWATTRASETATTASSASQATSSPAQRSVRSSARCVAQNCTHLTHADARNLLHLQMARAGIEAVCTHHRARSRSRHTHGRHPARSCAISVVI